MEDVRDDFNDWRYRCPTCGLTYLNDSNEDLGRCDCGQRLIFPRFDDMKREWLSKYHWSEKQERWLRGGTKDDKTY